MDSARNNLRSQEIVDSFEYARIATITVCAFGFADVIAGSVACVPRPCCIISGLPFSFCFAAIFQWSECPAFDLSAA
jgi:hypothetical protein